MLADLRSPGCVPSDNLWSEWSAPGVTAVACGEALEFVLRHLPQPPATVLEVGCGNGYLSLELARAGYTVTGIDPNEDAIAVAMAAAAQDPLETPRHVTYRTMGLLDLQAEPFDAAICNRSLHHLPRLSDSVRRIASLLRPGGRILCREFTRDTFDERTARWLLGTIRLLAACKGTAPQAPAIGDASDFHQRWHERFRDHDLHPSHAMLEQLRACFTETVLQPLPYLYVYAVNAADGSNRRNPTRRLVRELMALEETLIHDGSIHAAAFAFVGVKPQPSQEESPAKRPGVRRQAAKRTTRKKKS